MFVCAASSNDRLPLVFPADCVLEGTFTGAFFVGALLPFFVALLFSGGPCSSLELVVRLQLDELELDGVGAFRFSAFVVCFFPAAFASLASSFSCSISSFIFTISLTPVPGICEG